MKALVGAFNQEIALVGAFFVIVKTGCETDGALHSSTLETISTQSAASYYGDEWFHFTFYIYYEQVSANMLGLGVST